MPIYCNLFFSGFNFWSYVLFCFSHCGGYFPWVISLYTELYDLHFIIWHSELPGKSVCFSFCRHEKAIWVGEEITERMWNHDRPGNFLSNCISVDISYNIRSYELGLSCTLHVKKKTNGKIKYLHSDRFFKLYFYSECLQNHPRPFCHWELLFADQETAFA